MPLKVLIVEDEQDILNLYKQIFKKQAGALVFARSGNEAIEILSKEPVGMIISDFEMPDGNGKELLHYVETNFPKTFFYFHSGTHLRLDDEPFVKGLIRKPHGVPAMVDLVLKFITPQVAHEKSLLRGEF